VAELLEYMDSTIERLQLRVYLTATEKKRAVKALKRECDMHMARLSGHRAVPGPQLALGHGGGVSGTEVEEDDLGNSDTEAAAGTEAAAPPLAHISTINTNAPPVFRIIDKFLNSVDGGARKTWGAVCTVQVEPLPVSGYDGG
jgi:hypothetical protein